MTCPRCGLKPADQHLCNQPMCPMKPASRDVTDLERQLWDQGKERTR